ncbi:hypothetical protein MUCCIDRAFT_182101 [Mucor lusitanicus CBS 277.49]|uniref:Uncharacterized protein n=1 Tax=Mucor lusitanicus CBS 277.49 TaxID=747725 RepID=A0A162RMQ9_MUCCL|nr:hypothetical protein MUCCIDRAFT_182101 [Mucor lusitanicus CBS 277.49]
MRPRLDDGCTCARTCCFDALRLDQEDSDQEYSCRESTPSSESTEGIIERPNAKRKDYLVSTNGSDVIDLTSLDHKWILKSGDHQVQSKFSLADRLNNELPA